MEARDSAAGQPALHVVRDLAPPTPTTGDGQHKLWAVVSAIGLIAVTAIVYWRLAVPDQWDGALFFCLLSISLLASFAAVDLKPRWSVDSSDAPALVGVVLLGPLAGLLILVVPGLAQWGLERYRPIALLANLAGESAEVVAMSCVVLLLGVVPTSGSPSAELTLPCVLIAGIVGITVNYIGRLILSGADAVSRRRIFAEETLAVLPANVIQSSMAALAVVSYLQIGIVGLAFLPLGVLGFNIVVARRWRATVKGQASSADVRSRAVAIAEQLRLEGRQVSVIEDAASQLCGDPTLRRLHNFEPVMNVVLYSTERWDGREGFPGLLSGAEIPVESRVLCVAQAWSDLARRPGPPADDVVLGQLWARAGAQFDPAVVAAAANAADLALPKPPKLRFAGSAG